MTEIAVLTPPKGEWSCVLQICEMISVGTTCPWATVTYPNSLITAYTYDQLNRITGTSTSTISNYTYELGQFLRRCA